MNTMSPAITQSDTNHTKFVTNKHLTHQTFFLRNNLVDISKAPLLAQSPHNIIHNHTYKTIPYNTPGMKITTFVPTDQDKKSKKNDQKCGNLSRFLSCW
mmetsp:Transcript_30223/g.34328  ORF Transcript_30223/g.34328 Transcript_30223/m.34328 type:complete len:99 (-) Transcript_30223:7-303(-)